MNIFHFSHIDRWGFSILLAGPGYGIDSLTRIPPGEFCPGCDPWLQSRGHPHCPVCHGGWEPEWAGAEDAYCRAHRASGPARREERDLFGNDVYASGHYDDFGRREP